MDLRNATGDLTGRQAIHVIDAGGVARPVSPTNPLITTPSPQTTDWAAVATAANALATATRAAEPGNSHRITGVLASFSGSSVALLTVKNGAAIIAQHYVTNQSIITLPAPLKASIGNAVSAELAAGGVSITGTVTLLGFTVTG